ncbi:uncharacterized protein LACBIDRAFT_315990 [Laccaria bicolor S238N-H82]|uniref:Predicted protein n=1 Tax=Laccaria bicolor (strain S238N-H82 / ATCC MYA-4686) TaxID=486041 RepID=B0D3N3_LACBS|nr:uncharacterized protein LACBIDRAFT_315990 [Laccaria bicolor S238N-H82]EDR10954.1 predicted protein [Laccaria bicolor S238N-H82]|eukprot:XP_001878255.1 predicted protein [Laccaria bicolor S238N-H82]
MASSVQDVFMLFGDSITQGGWGPGLNGMGQRLSHVYARKLDVLNRGYSGYNTEWAIPVFEQCFAKRTDGHAPKVQVLTIWFGANDACIKPSPQHVPLSKFVSNMKHLVQMVKSPTSAYYSPTTRIILITPPPVDTYQRRADLESRNPPIALDRLFATTEAYAQAVKDVAAEENVAVVDVWGTLWEAVGKEEKLLNKFLIDGLHLNEAGYQVVYDELIKTIAQMHPEVHYDNLGPIFPPWAQIDWDAPSNSLYIKAV